MEQDSGESRVKGQGSRVAGHRSRVVVIHRWRASRSQDAHRSFPERQGI